MEASASNDPPNRRSKDATVFMVQGGGDIEANDPTRRELGILGVGHRRAALGHAAAVSPDISP